MQNLVPKALLSHYSNSVFFFILLQILSFTDTFLSVRILLLKLVNFSCETFLPIHYS